MKVYYNEIDPKAAAWLRELIKQGHIADGIVDERSIVDVKSEELIGYNQCHFFAGIGVWSYALRQAGWSDDRPIWTASCPCQPFSTAGQGKAEEDERHLFPVLRKLIAERKPQLIVGEQVASKSAITWLDNVQSQLEEEDYACGAVVFPACGIGSPHQRQRTYWVAKSSVAQDTSRIGRPGRGDGDSTGGGRALQVEGLSASGKLAHDQSERELRESGATCEAERGQKPELHRESERAGLSGELANNQSTERQSANNPRSGRDGLADSGTISGLPDNPGNRLQEQCEVGREEIRITGNGEVGGLSDTRGSRRAHRLPESQERQEGFAEECRNGSEGQFATGHPGPTNGLWRNVDWLYCRDGKWRPVESGTFPLANGAAERVGRLRGYGNAIVAEQAKIFIETVKECV